MDLREYTYITYRPDTFPRSTLKSIRDVLSNTQSDSVRLIDKILSEGYIEPPSEYKWHGCYQAVLSEKEIKAVLDGLMRAQNTLANSPSFSDAERNSLQQYISFWSRKMSEVPESYDDYKSKQTYFDLRHIDFEQFLTFVFEHEVADRSKKEEPWYFNNNIWIDYEKEHVAKLFIELFHESDKLLTLFSRNKLEQGFWAVMGSNLECSAYQLVHDRDIDITLKEQLICSMYFLYEKLFSKDPLETASNMWWDSFAYDYCVDGARDPVENEEDRRIQDAMFSTLVKVLAIKSEACQGDALHGLGHLRHPKTAEIINDFIERNKQLTDEQIAYTKACITGDIM